MSNIPFLNNASFSQDVGIGGEFTPNARLDIRDATNNILRIGTRGGTMDLFSVNNAGAAAPLNFEASEFNFLTGDVNFNNSIVVDKLVVIDSLNNSFIGEDSGKLNTTGSNNTAFGSNSLENNTTGSTNTAIGFNALFFNTTGDNNVALGFTAGISNTTGDKNIAIGLQAMGGLDGSKNEGDQNIAIGITALPRNTTGFFNIALGTSALSQNNTGQTNIGIGVDALGSNTTGSDNTGLGAGALQKNQTGSDNIAIGAEAGEFYYFNNGGSISQGNNTTPEKSIFIGSGTGPNSNGETNQIVIGDSAVGNGTNTVTLGNDNVTDTHLKGNVQTNGSVSAVGGTFSSNVNFTASNGNYFTLNNGTHDSIQIFQQSVGYGFYNNVTASNDLVFSNSSGAATFASSVTATDGNFSGTLNLTRANGGLSAYHTLDRNAITTESMFKWRTAGLDKWFLGQRSVGSDKFSLYSAAVARDVLTIETNGTSVFSSTVAVNGALIAQNSASPGVLQINGGQANVINYEISNVISGVSNSGLTIVNSSSNTKILTFNSLNEAAFASSVTAGNSSTVTNSSLELIGYSSTTKSHIGQFANSLYLSSNYFYNGSQNSDDNTKGQAGVVISSGSSNTSFIGFNLSDAGSTFPTEKLRIASSGVATFASSVELGTNNTTLNGRTTGGTLVGMLKVDQFNNTQLGDSGGGYALELVGSSLLYTGGTAKFTSSVAVGNDNNSASASNQGAIRYRTSGNNSYVDMSMRTGASSYMWVNIVQNNW